MTEETGAYILHPFGTLAFAYDKAQTWADCMARPFFVCEYAKGKFDAFSDATARRVVAKICPQ
jgi:hypothetical protein